MATLKSTLGTLALGWWALTAGPGTAQAAEPVPATAESVLALLSSMPIRFYGIIKPTFIVSNGVESFTQANSSAVTAAAHPVFVEDTGAPNYTFQVAQSRLGLWVGEGLPVRGQLEVDFLHTDIASPSVGAFPRLRIASVEWEPLKGHKLFVGQGWDIFSPLNPHTTNLVSNLFFAGNSGFLRQQVAWSSSLAGLEVAVAVGLPTVNNAPSAGNLEYALTPTAVARLSYRLEKLVWLGGSVLGGLNRFTSANGPEQRRPTLVGNLFLEVSAGPLNLRLEGYAGQNGANAGLQTLATARYGRDVQELGGFISARHALGDLHSGFLTLGAAGVTQPGDVAPGYTPLVASAKAVRTGPGLDHNAMLRAGYLLSPLKWVALFAEPFVVYSRHHLAKGDAGRFNPDRVAVGLESGVMLKF